MLSVSVEHRPAVHRRLVRGDGGVLLEHEPSVIAVSHARRAGPRRSAHRPVQAAETVPALVADSSEQLTRSQPGRDRRVDVLEMHVHDAVAVVARRTRTGSVPPISRCPVSRHQPTSSTLERELHLLVGLDQRPHVGMQRDRQAVAGGDRLDRVDVARPDCRQPSSSSARRLRSSPHPGRSAAPASCRRRRPSATTLPGRPRRVPSAGGGAPAPRTRRPAESRGADQRRQRAGSSGKNPGGPSSVPRSPSDAISDSTVSGSGITPQPGTSHAPHEIGAPANRSSSDLVRAAPEGLASGSRALLVLSLGLGALKSPKRLERSKASADYIPLEP